MNLLLIAETVHGLSIPGFGPEFEAHMAAKHNPAVHDSSCTAWHLLALALKKNGIDHLPQVQFEEMGKPVFADSPLHFSLAHSGRLAAALLSDSPCALDVEVVKEHVREKLKDRCMNEQERMLDCDFFECWTKKECLSKFSGKGLPARPADMDSLNPEYRDHWHLYRFTDSSQQAYQLCALCMNPEELQIQKIGPEELQ